MVSRLRTLTADELCEIASQVPLLGGDVALLKHYLPRLLEIAVDGDGFDGPDLEIVFSHIGYDDDEPWTRWPEDEQAAVRDFLRAFWLARLAEDIDHEWYGSRVDDALCGIGLIDPDIAWYLRAWLDFDHPNAALHLERFLELNLAGTKPGRLHNTYWARKMSPSADNMPRVVAWTRAESTKELVAAAADRARTPAEREALTECYLRWL